MSKKVFYTVNEIVNGLIEFFILLEKLLKFIIKKKNRGIYCTLGCIILYFTLSWTAKLTYFMMIDFGIYYYKIDRIDYLLNLF